MIDRRIGSLLSLAMKAGQVTTGEVSCEKALQKGNAQLVILADDSSDNTKKKFTNKAFYYKIPVCIYGSRQELSKQIGRENRAVFAITNEHFAKKIKEMIEDTLCDTVG